jgi:hypothetical protein
MPSGHADMDNEVYDGVDAMTNDRAIVTEAISEHGEEGPHHTQEVPEAMEIEEIGQSYPGDVIFSEYMVSEAASDVSQIRTGTISPSVTLGDHAQRCNSVEILPTRSAPAISVGSNTPPLSPAATVTNSSSAADPSIATSDLSTVNQASVSVVTSAGSPPPIHVPRLSTQADIRHPFPHLAYGSEDDHNDGDGMSVLPDPRLPPEPTHLGIPVGVVGRSLREDKEERAESMKVEPPRSESEGGSLTVEGRNKLDTEGTSPVENVLRSGEEGVIMCEGLGKIPGKNVASGSSVEQVVTGTNPDEVDEEQNDEASDDLVYPDSPSDPLSKENGEDNSSVTEARNVSPSPPQSPGIFDPLLGILSKTPTDGVPIVVQDTKGFDFPQPSSDGVTSNEGNGHYTGLNACGYASHILRTTN